ncbi:HvfC/BufC N-terminal domain-containing protein [Ferrovibrio xuzhouensis]|uniref:DUF2063 domain-containing protein n=1 Tax=Ferrovibrio xuzhouensis TaxID=1576914 RepID=A0ABV7VIY4_9PROT
MSRTLFDIQHCFGSALLDPAAPPPVGVGGRDGRPDERRFAVYRNNVTVGLIEALRARFPVCERLVGEEFFQAMARVYVMANKPRSPLLMTYGDEFPAFIAGFRPAAAVPYLADVARLEVAWGQAYHEAEAVALDIRTLSSVQVSDLVGARIVLHPSARIVRSPHPIASIWLAHQSTGAVDPPDEWRPEDVLVVRPDADVLMHRLPAGGYSFISKILDGSCVGDAAESGLSEAADFELGGNLIGLLRTGAVIDFVTLATLEMTS